jgi:hypothetical protein
MKHVYLFVFLVSGFMASAQVMDRDQFDCSGNMRSIHQVLGTGKALIVASKGFDCSICVSRAPGWGTFASSNKTKVEVWGAMTFTYSNNIPSCAAVTNWVSSHGWSDVFTFIDSSEYYFEFGTPRYIVYSPADSSVIYTGGSHTQARTMALNASTVSNITLPENILEQLQYYMANGTLIFKNIPEGNTFVEIYNLTGKKERVFTLRKDQNEFLINDLPKGIYLMQLRNNQLAVSRKIVKR